MRLGGHPAKRGSRNSIVSRVHADLWRAAAPAFRMAVPMGSRMCLTFHGTRPHGAGAVDLLHRPAEDPRRVTLATPLQVLGGAQLGQSSTALSTRRMSAYQTNNDATSQAIFQRSAPRPCDQDQDRRSVPACTTQSRFPEQVQLGQNSRYTARHMAPQSGRQLETSSS